MNSESHLFIPLSCCGLYYLIPQDKVELFQAEHKQTPKITCSNCREKETLLDQIHDLNNTIMKQQEQISDLRNIKENENFLDQTIENLSNQFADFRLNDMNQSMHVGATQTVSNILYNRFNLNNLNNLSTQSGLSSAWSESETTINTTDSKTTPAINVHLNGVDNDIHTVLSNETSNSIHETVESTTSEIDASATLFSDQELKNNSPPVTVKYQNIKTLIIGDGFTSNMEMANSSNVHLANYPTAGIASMTKALEYLITEKYHFIENIVVHAGTNDVNYGMKTEELNECYKKLFEKMNQHEKRLIISGPISKPVNSSEQFSRLANLNEWLKKWCETNSILFVNNIATEWTTLNLFNSFGTKLNKKGKEKLSTNISNARQ